MSDTASSPAIHSALIVVAQLANDDPAYGALLDRLACDLEEAKAREGGGTDAQHRARAFLAKAA